MQTAILLIGIFILWLYLGYDSTVKPALERRAQAKMPTGWQRILSKKVFFYSQLKGKDKDRFERDIVRFLSKVKITGVSCTVELEDRLLVASSGVIPLFGFPACT